MVKLIFICEILAFVLKVHIFQLLYYFLDGKLKIRKKNFLFDKNKFE